MRTPTVKSRLSRALGGMACLLALALVCLLHPALRLNPLGQLSNNFAVVLTAAAVFAALLPAEIPRLQRWQESRWLLLCSVWTAAGTAPFLSWWLRARDSLYLMSAAAVFPLSLVCLATALTRVVEELAEACGDTHLRRRCRVVRALLLYGVLAPALAVYASLAAVVLFIPGNAIRDLPRYWQLVPVALKVAMTLPMLDAGVALWRTRRMIEDSDNLLWEENSWPPPEGPE